ncbi:uncharacterized protein MONBRDRAFT_14354 [Monosiga brevicollis MX1]|uniref:Steroid 5-alpha reductase C-terminal domain-containing protein n=1 Tax=Monosiga brevicollis TaxID=81824 RepID=A9URF2_MONBE|nr:uncharacterized protein MONBRDRAFT_14354 [Monosiga brevicollis MX1]EDQ92234.1 predicted protein [Monosiga brevicollis MX1]|eukprot:XP_001743520.1 hypothetical protein [Monosiga brevicollis MX1]
MAIGDVLPGDTHFLGLTALVTVGYQLVFFAVAYTFKFDKVTDFAGGTNFALIAFLTFGLGDTFYARQAVLTGMVALSKLYLALFLLIRVLSRGKDARFDGTRDSFFKFLSFFIFQMIWVWVVSLPVTFVNGDEDDPALNEGDYIGWALFLIGFMLQMSADITKFYFKQEADSADFCDEGPWAASRHPNYAGEILMWWGIFISATSVFEIPGNDHWGWVTILSPLLTMILLLFLSGIPTAEGQSQKRYMKKNRYLRYRERTPPLIPFIPYLYKRMPLWTKRLFCFELPMYEYDPEQEAMQAANRDMRSTVENTQTSQPRAAAAPTEHTVHRV